MGIDPVDLSRRYFAALDALDYDTIADFLAEDAVYRSGAVGGLSGKAEILDAFRKYFEDYPDQKAEESLVEAVSPLAARAVWTLTATSASTGRRFSRQGEETLTFNEDGLVVRVDMTDHEGSDVR